VDQLKLFLFSKFKMRDLGEAKRFLSLEIEKTPTHISVDQKLFIEKVVRKFELGDKRSRTTPLNAGTKDVKL